MMLLVHTFRCIDDLLTTIQGACIDLCCGELYACPGLDFDSVDVPSLTFHDHGSSFGVGVERVLQPLLTAILHKKFTSNVLPYDSDCHSTSPCDRYGTVRFKFHINRIKSKSQS